MVSLFLEANSCFFPQYHAMAASHPISSPSAAPVTFDEGSGRRKHDQRSPSTSPQKSWSSGAGQQSFQWPPEAARRGARRRLARRLAQATCIALHPELQPGHQSEIFQLFNFDSIGTCSSRHNGAGSRTLWTEVTIPFPPEQPNEGCLRYKSRLNNIKYF